MKTGKTLSQLAAELERQQETKRDFVASTSALTMVPTPGASTIGILPPQEVSRELSMIGALPVNDVAHRQIAERVSIPAKYYDRMRAEAPTLLCRNVNHWFAETPENRMVRTLDGKARAFLSDRYQRIDNADVAQLVLPVLADVPGLSIVSCEITERKMYIKAVTDRVSGEVKVGDEVQAGVVISNSEIGFGALVVEPLVFRLVCLNGMTVNDAKFRRHHVGARADVSDGVYSMLSDETLAADDKAIGLKARDVVRGALDQVFFDKIIGRMRETTEHGITGDPVKAVEVLSNRLSLTGEEQGGVLRHLIEGGDLSQWGVLNAVTRTAQDVESYDRSTELEAAGGTILDLPASDWKVIAEAA